MQAARGDVGLALVLAGGGAAGLAWELGVLRGLADVEPALARQVLDADVVVGTSAGASVALQITSRVPLIELYDAQLRPETAEVDVDVDLRRLFADMAAVTRGVTDAAEAGRRLGAWARAAVTPDHGVRRPAIRGRLPVDTWPARDVRITAVDADSGELAVFTPESSIPVLDAAAASAAVPGVWPPVPIGARTYIDGGVRSATNAELARGARRVLILLPTAAGSGPAWCRFPDQLAALAPADVVLISADDASLRAIGPDPLRPATRGPAARAGREVGRTRGADLARRWSTPA